MKKLKLNLVTFTIAAIMISSCGGLNKMVENSESVSYDVNPSPLETHGGEVEVTIKTKYPEKFFNKKAILVATPTIKYEGGQTEYDSTVLQGEKVEANNQVISYEGGEYTFKGSVPYKPEMLKSELVVDMTAKIKDKSVAIPGVKIADGVIATPTLVQVNPKVISSGDNFERTTPVEYNADIHYVINKANIRGSELRSEDVESFESNLDAAAVDEKVKIKGAKISSYASPDGEYELNEKLSGKRGSSAERYLTRALKKLDVEGYDAEGFLSTIETAEDWDGFKELMEQSDIQDKELILRVLSMYSDPAVREKEIKNISEAFEVIKEKILPELRRSKLIIEAEKIGYSDEELLELVKSNPDTLNIEEILYTANLVEDPAEKESIYQAAVTNFPNEFRAINNLGYIQYEQGKLDDASNSFNQAQGLEDNDVVKNNLGAIALAQGDIETAEELLTSAVGAGDEVNYNLGIIKIKQGEYEEAANYLGNITAFNAALAQLLNGQSDKAMATLNEIGETEDALVYYLKAVIGARSGNEDLLLTNLRKAVELEPSLKEYAKKDLEYRKYTANEGFTSIVE